VANASHELRTPLTRERTLLQVALDDPSTSDIWRSTGDELLASNREQEALIEALLALANSEGGVERHEAIDLAVLTQSILRKERPNIDRLGLRVETVISSAPLEGDPDLIERLVANLLDNAVDHNVAGGHVQISVGMIDSQAALSVANTGPAIPPSEIDRLFQPFQRLETGRVGHQGHGLGLSIVGAIATAHGALVSAQAPESGGLIVCATFPHAARDREDLTEP
jgi:signal transduction histidine kinase